MLMLVLYSHPYESCRRGELVHVEYLPFEWTPDDSLFTFIHLWAVIVRTWSFFQHTVIIRISPRTTPWAGCIGSFPMVKYGLSNLSWNYVQNSNVVVVSRADY